MRKGSRMFKKQPIEMIDSNSYETIKRIVDEKLKPLETKIKQLECKHEDWDIEKALSYNLESPSTLKYVKRCINCDKVLDEDDLPKLVGKKCVHLKLDIWEKELLEKTANKLGYKIVKKKGE